MTPKNSNNKQQKFGLQTIDNKISSLLKPILNNSKKEYILINNLVKNWSQIVGEKSAKFCMPKIVNFLPRFFGLILTTFLRSKCFGYIFVACDQNKPR